MNKCNYVLLRSLVFICDPYSWLKRKWSYHSLLEVLEEVPWLSLRSQARGVMSFFLASLVDHGTVLTLPQVFWLQVSVYYMENSLGLCSHTNLVWHKWFIFLVFLRPLFCWKASEDWSTKGQGILKQWHLLVDWDCHTFWLSIPENWLRFSSLKLKFTHSLGIYYMKRPIYFAL